MQQFVILNFFGVRMESTWLKMRAKSLVLLFLTYFVLKRNEEIDKNFFKSFNV